MTATYGKLAVGRFEGQTKDSWYLQLQPHVASRVKRIFPRSRGHRTGQLTIVITPETSKDLAWLMERWPLEASDGTRRRLELEVATYDALREDVQLILDGTVPERPRPVPAVDTFRSYQEEAAAMAVTSGGLLLADDVGVGKTHSALATLTYEGRLPAVWVTLAHLIPQARAAFAKVLPSIRVHVASKTSPPDDIDMLLDGTDLVLLNYHKIAGWQYHLRDWARTVIFDEAHELRREKSQKYQAAANIADAASVRLGLTATPIYNYGDEMHNILDILRPGALGDRSEFLLEWGGGARGVSDPRALGSYLRDQGLMLRRTRKDVGRELPPVQEIIHTISIDSAEVDALADAEHLARTILANVSDDTGALFRAHGEFDYRMRLATGVAKARTVAAFTAMLAEAEPVVLYGWHHEVYDIWATEFARAGFYPAFYTGRESLSQKEANKARFLNGETNLLIMSLRAGAGLDGLQERSSVVVFGEFDWSPSMHIQDIGRLARDGQPLDRPVVAYYVAADEGADPFMLETNGVKERQARPILDPNLPLTAAKVNNTDRVRAMAKAYLDRHL